MNGAAVDVHGARFCTAENAPGRGWQSIGISGDVLE